MRLGRAEGHGWACGAFALNTRGFKFELPENQLCKLGEGLWLPQSHFLNGKAETTRFQLGAAVRINGNASPGLPCI